MSQETGFVAATVWSFGFGLAEPLSKINAHDQLYVALNNEKGDWYDAKGNESRRLQFVQKSNHNGQDFLLCRSNTQPENTNLFYQEQTINVKKGESIKLSVRLPAVRRFVHKGKTSMRTILDSDKDDYYSGVLERFGMKVLTIAWAAAPESTVVFNKKNSKVVIPVNDVAAHVEIVDAKIFIEAICNGVGRYKTYGCGMINTEKLKGLFQ